MKSKICISVDEETLNKIDESILKRRFRNRSHAFEYALHTILDKNKKSLRMGGENEDGR